MTDASGATPGTAKQEYDEYTKECDEGVPLERLRFFCSLAMKGQDWLDVEPFFAAVERALQSAQADAEQARRFAVKMFELSDWPEGGDIDGFDFQESAVECGLLYKETRTEPCGENCHCEEYSGEWPTECYRKAQWLIDAAIAAEKERG